MPRQKKRTTQGRKPTYGAATRLARLVHELRERPNGWSFEAIQEDLRITERTLARYLEACRRELVDQRERPLLEVVRRGDRRFVKLADTHTGPATTDYEVLALFFTLRLARVLEGTVFESVNKDLWGKMLKTVPAAARRRLENADRKFFALAHLPKSYSTMEDELDLLLRALIDQMRLVIDYGGVVGEGRTHDFDPYSLVEHRGGLYLLGRSSQYRKTVWLAVDRIRSVETKVDGEGLKIHFNYPKGFDPARHTNGMFGIVDGETTRVELAIQNAETEAYLRARQLHATQKFFRGSDGKTHLELKVRGTTELSNWIMSTSPWVEVVQPPELRAEIAKRLKETTALYAQRYRSSSATQRSAQPKARTAHVGG
ncbi:MAG: WYL domain-containing protein [Candidatus Binatia bacterium]|nr:WYL domain-containing protein [Candidatus Binatia bacterium]